MREYFELDLDELRAAAAWAADFAEASLGLFEARHPEDSRPRFALAGARAFARGGRRTNELRRLAMDAYRAASGSGDAAARAAAMAASLAAAVAYTHPFRDLAQAEHVLGPVAWSALALDLGGGGPERGAALVDEAARAAGGVVAGLLRRFPRHEPGGTGLDGYLGRLDAGALASTPSIED